jgi:hypothetical protein
MKPKPLTPPQQRQLEKRREEEERLHRVGDAIKKHFSKQDLALRRWAKPML